MEIVRTGVVEGRHIRLSEDMGLRDGQRVRITVESVEAASTWGEGIMRSAGALADCAEFDAVFQQIERERKYIRRPRSSAGSTAEFPGE
jgi:hypothetical protein